MRSPSTPTLVCFSLALLAKAAGAAPLPPQQHSPSLSLQELNVNRHVPRSPADGTCGPVIVNVDKTVTSTVTKVVTRTVQATPGAINGQQPTGSAGVSPAPSAVSPSPQISPPQKGPFTSSHSTSLVQPGASGSGSAGSSTDGSTALTPSGGDASPSGGQPSPTPSNNSSPSPTPTPSEGASPTPSPSAGPSPGPSSGSSGNSSGTGGSSASNPKPSGSGGSGGASGGPKGGKRGIGYNNAALLSAFAGKASWAHNWEQTNAGVPGGMQYFPTLWNGEGQRIARWKASADAAIARGDNVLFSFNEPIASFCPGNPSGHQPQACMTADVAASVWREHMMPYKDKAALVAPSVPQGDEGAQWLADFIRLCPKAECGWSALNLHWYEGAHQIEYFKKYYSDAHTAHDNADIWIGEFNPTAGSDAEKAQFYKDAMTWMDSQPWIKGYAAFWAEDLAPGGQLTPVGTAYAA